MCVAWRLLLRVAVAVCCLLCFATVLAGVVCLLSLLLVVGDCCGLVSVVCRCLVMFVAALC